MIKVNISKTSNLSWDKQQNFANADSMLRWIQEQKHPVLVFALDYPLNVILIIYDTYMGHGVKING